MDVVWLWIKIKVFENEVDVWKLHTDGEKLEQMDKFMYLGIKFIKMENVTFKDFFAEKIMGSWALLEGENYFSK